MLDVSLAPGHTLEDVDNPVCDEDARYLALYTKTLDDPIFRPSTAYINYAGPAILECKTGQELQDAMTLYDIYESGGDFGVIEDQPQYPGSYQSSVATSYLLAPRSSGLEADVAHPRLYMVPTQSRDSDIWDTFFSPTVLSDIHIQLSDLIGPPKPASSLSLSLQAPSYLEQCFSGFTSRGNANNGNPRGAQPIDQHAQQEPELRRKRGRPKGSKNRPKDQWQTPKEPRKPGRPKGSRNFKRCVACKQRGLQCNRNNPPKTANVPCANRIQYGVKCCKMPWSDHGGADGHDAVNKTDRQESNGEGKRYASIDEDDKRPQVQLQRRREEAQADRRQ